jgi:hypothetical protein
VAAERRKTGFRKRISGQLKRDQTIGRFYLMKVRDFTTVRRMLAGEIVSVMWEHLYDGWRRICVVLDDQQPSRTRRGSPGDPCMACD